LDRQLQLILSLMLVRLRGVDYGPLLVVCQSLTGKKF
jgi:hypothetical protein